MTEPTIHPERLRAGLLELAKIGATPEGGACRRAPTDPDRQARDLLVRWCEEAGCSVRVDPTGTLFARRRGRNDALAPVAIGGCLDTRPTDARFDGVYGVLAGLEVIRSLNDLGIETERPVELSVRANPDGVGGTPALLDPEVCTGAERAHSGELDEPVGHHPVHACFEAHLEPGPGPGPGAQARAIGIVTAAQPGVPFDEGCVAALRQAARALGQATRDIVSGAGHHACGLSSGAPTAAIIVPCVGGTGDDAIDAATAAWLTAGADVLLHAVLSKANELPDVFTSNATLAIA